MIQGMVNEIKKLYKEEPKVVITGGASRFIKDLFDDSVIFDDILLLKGLLVIFNKNK